MSQNHKCPLLKCFLGALVNFCCFSYTQSCILDVLSLCHIIFQLRFDYLQIQILYLIPELFFSYILLSSSLLFLLLLCVSLHDAMTNYTTYIKMAKYLYSLILCFQLKGTIVDCFPCLSGKDSNQRCEY